MGKGATKAAENQVGLDNNYASTLQGNAGTDRSSVLPFLTNEVTNPTGFGQDTINQMQTAGGQAAAGATGAAGEGASLLASRTGNTAAVPGIIDSTARNAMKQQSDNTLDILSKNAALKNQQQQEGAKGLTDLYGTDTGSALKSLGLSDESINAWTNADNATSNTIKNAFQDYGTVAGSGLGAAKAAGFG